MDADSTGGSTRLIVSIVVLIAISGFFSMAETALTSVSRLKIRSMLDGHVKGAETLARLKDNPNKFLTAILIGNNFVNILASTLATVYASTFTNNNATMIATGVMTFLILTFGEITPKTLASQNAEKIALVMAGPISFIQTILTPVIFLLNFVTGILLKLMGVDAQASAQLITEAEFKTMVDVGHEEGVLEHDERRMINNVVDFGDYEAKAVMTPRTKIVGAEVGATYEEITEIFKEERFSRLPIYEETIDDIIGILYLKDILFLDKEEDFDLKSLLREAYFTYESKSTVELFAIMRNNRYPMTVVLDEYGGTSGIITVEDLVEEIVGEIIDEYDESGDIEHIKDHEYIVEGSTRIDEVNEMIGTNLSSENFDSIGGYVIELLGRFPEQGEAIDTEDILFYIEEVERNRIEKIRITKKIMAKDPAVESEAEDTPKEN